MRQAPAVVRLIVKPASFLALTQRRDELQARLGDCNLLRDSPVGGFDVFAQLFKVARARVIFPDECGRIYRLAHRGRDLILERLHAGGGDLSHDHIAVAIEHEPRQPV